jgi:hypothetical protein
MVEQASAVSVREEANQSTQQAGEPLIIATGDLAFHEQCESILEGKAVDVRVFELLFECGRHAWQAQLMESFERLVEHHGLPPSAAA